MRFSYEPFTMRNVVSKRYFTTKEQIPNAQKQFLGELLSVEGIVIRGPFVYMIEPLSEVKEGWHRGWFMTAIENEYNAGLESYKYDSYFGLEQAICCRVYPKELATEAEQIYTRMEQKCKEDGYKIISPIYFVRMPLEMGGFYSLYGAIEKQ